MKWLNALRKTVAEWLMPTAEPIVTALPAVVEQAAEAAAVTPQVVANYTPVSGQPGLVCPQCSHKIAVTIPMLLSGQPFYCTACFLEIAVNQTESASALASLSKLQGQFDKANSIVNSSKKS